MATKYNGRFASLPPAMLQDRWNESHMRVMLAISLHSGRDGWCAVSLRQVQKLSLRSRPTVIKCLAELEDGGLVEVRKVQRANGAHGTTEYRVKLDVTLEHDEDTPRPVREKEGQAHRKMFGLFHTLTQLDPKMPANAGRLNRAVKDFRKAGYTEDDLRGWLKYWKTQDFRGQKGQLPTPEQIISTMGPAQAWLKGEDVLEIAGEPNANPVDAWDAEARERGYDSLQDYLDADAIAKTLFTASVAAAGGGKV